MAVHHHCCHHCCCHRYCCCYCCHNHCCHCCHHFLKELCRCLCLCCCHCAVTIAFWKGHCCRFWKGCCCRFWKGCCCRFSKEPLPLLFASAVIFACAFGNGHRFWKQPSLLERAVAFRERLSLSRERLSLSRERDCRFLRESSRRFLGEIESQLRREIGAFWRERADSFWESHRFSRDLPSFSQTPAFVGDIAFWETNESVAKHVIIVSVRAECCWQHNISEIEMVCSPLPVWAEKGNKGETDDWWPRTQHDHKQDWYRLHHELLPNLPHTLAETFPRIPCFEHSECHAFACAIQSTICHMNAAEIRMTANIHMTADINVNIFLRM